METYQPIYDAVRSRISNGDIGAAVEAAMRDANVSHYAERAADAVHCAVHCAAAEYQRPSVMFRPRLSIDGGQWCALYGENLQDGVAGFGDSPAKAMLDFDRAWAKDLETPNYNWAA